jgi:hypothetical protein
LLHPLPHFSHLILSISRECPFRIVGFFRRLTRLSMPENEEIHTRKTLLNGYEACYCDKCEAPGSGKIQHDENSCCCKYAVLPKICMLCKQGYPDNDTSADNEFQEHVEIIHRLDCFSRED